MKKLLSVILAVVMMVATLCVPANASHPGTFADVGPGEFSM